MKSQIPGMNESKSSSRGDVQLSLLIRHENETFVRSSLPLCGHEYIGCHFISCELIFDGSRGIYMIGCHVDGGCRIELVGAAGTTAKLFRDILNPASGLGHLGKQLLQLLNVESEVLE